MAATRSWAAFCATTGTFFGAPYENHCAGVFTVHDGKIRAVREYMDTHYAHKHALNRIEVPVQGGAV